MLRFLLVASTALIVISYAYTQPRVFRSHPYAKLGTEANRTASVSLGDLDGDGDLDVTVANGRHWAQQNKVFFNDGRGFFRIAINLGSELNTTYATPMADLDSDGDLDVVVGNDRVQGIVFYNENGTFQSSAKFAVDGRNTRSVTLFDINGDRHIDILLTNRGQVNDIFLNDGKGNFDEHTTFGQQDDSTIDVVAADLDGDGNQDLVLANRDGQANFVAYNNGKLGFERRVQFGTGEDETRGVAVADLNGDGNLDICTANIGEPNGVFFGDGKGGFAGATSFGDRERTYSIVVSDLDLDGDIDIVVSNVGEQNAVYFNDGSGSKFIEHRFGLEEGITYGVAVGDLNADSFPDLITANSDGQNIVYFNRRPQ